MHSLSNDKNDGPLTPITKDNSMRNRREIMTVTGATALGFLASSGTSFGKHPEAKTGLNSTANNAFKFKLSLAAYSYRQLLTGNKPELTLTDFIDDCAKFGLEGTELTSYYFPESPTPEFLYQLKSHSFRSGLDISGTAIRNDFGFADGTKREENISHVKKWIEYAEMMGTSVIRVFAGHQKKGISEQETHRLMVAGFEECCDYAGKHGVHLALENHGGPTATADGLLKFVNDVKSDWFGVNLDTGNFHSKDIYGDLEKVAKHALNVQVKVVVSGPDKKKRPADFTRIAKILRSANYRGYVVLEFEETGDPRIECPKYLNKLREVLK